MILFSPPFRRASCASWSPTSDSPEKQKRQKISPVLQAKALKQYVLTNKNKQTNRQTDKQANELKTTTTTKKVYVWTHSLAQLKVANQEDMQHRPAVSDQ